MCRQATPPTWRATGSGSGGGWQRARFFMKACIACWPLSRICTASVSRCAGRPTSWLRLWRPKRSRPVGSRCPLGTLCRKWCCWTPTWWTGQPAQRLKIQCRCVRSPPQSKPTLHPVCTQRWRPPGSLDGARWLSALAAVDLSCWQRGPMPPCVGWLARPAFTGCWTNAVRLLNWRWRSGLPIGVHGPPLQEALACSRLTPQRKRSGKT